MAKGKRAKLRKQQQGMEVEGQTAGSGSGGVPDGGWMTGPASMGEGDDFIAMDTTDVGAAKQGKQPGSGGGGGGSSGGGGAKLPAPKRGQSSRKQQARKRKSLERALAVASRKETKVTQREGETVKKKVLKKLWVNEKKGD